MSMKADILALALVVLVWLGPSTAMAQPPASQHSVTLTWTDTLNPTGTTYTVYRATGLCSAPSAYVKVKEGVAGLTWEDMTVSPGNYCYYVTSVFNGMESAPSQTAAAPVPSFPPTELKGIVK